MRNNNNNQQNRRVLIFDSPESVRSRNSNQNEANDDNNNGNEQQREVHQRNPQPGCFRVFTTTRPNPSSKSSIDLLGEELDNENRGDELKKRVVNPKKVKLPSRSLDDCFEPFPPNIKITKSLKTLINSPRARAIITPTFRSITFPDPFYIVSGLTFQKKEWRTVVDGSASCGVYNILEDHDELNGPGKLLDASGNYFYGFFKENLLYKGISFFRDEGLILLIDLPEDQNLDEPYETLLLYNPGKQTIYSGSIKDFLFHGTGTLSYLNKSPKYFLNNKSFHLIYTTVNSKAFKNGLIQGKATIKAMITKSTNNSFVFEVSCEDSNVEYIHTSKSMNLQLIHDTPAENFDNHLCLLLQNYDSSACYLGILNSVFETGYGIKVTEDFVLIENKRGRRPCGKSFYCFESQDSYLEIDWNDDLLEGDPNIQVGRGVQIMLKAGIMIFGQWRKNVMRGAPFVWSIEKVVTLVGGVYKNEGNGGPEAGGGQDEDNTLHFRFNNDILERGRYNLENNIKQYVVGQDDTGEEESGPNRDSLDEIIRNPQQLIELNADADQNDEFINNQNNEEFPQPDALILIEPQNDERGARPGLPVQPNADHTSPTQKSKKNKNKEFNNYLTVMVDSSDVIFSDIHLTSGKTLSDVKQAFMYNTGIYAEGQVELDERYKTCWLSGDCVYQESDLNFVYKGKIYRDDLVSGTLKSGYANLKGNFDDFVFREGSANLHFTEGYGFEGEFINQAAEGFGKLFKEGKLIKQGEWKAGVLVEDPRWMIAHGDKNTRFHRLCLFYTNPKKGFSRFLKRRAEIEKSGEKSDDTSPDDSNRTLIFNNVEMRTLKVYSKVFLFGKVSMKFTSKLNIQVVKCSGKMSCYLRPKPLRRFEMIRNHETYGDKVLFSVFYQLQNSQTSWLKEGEFSKDKFNVDFFELNFKNILMARFKTWRQKKAELVKNVSEGVLEKEERENGYLEHDLVEVVNFNYDFGRDYLRLKKRLGFQGLNSHKQLKFSFFVFKDMDERLVIRLRDDDLAGKAVKSEKRKKKNDGKEAHPIESEGMAIETISPKKKYYTPGRDKFTGIILHLDGRLSFGRIERCFLQGLGQRLNYTQAEHIKNRQIAKKGKSPFQSSQDFLKSTTAEFYFDLPHNKAEFVYANGAVYIGQSVFNKRHGVGIMKFSNGEVYSGDWFFDVKHGVGEYYWAEDGVRYQGEFQVNMMWGEGKMSFPDGRSIEGRFWKNEFVEPLGGGSGMFDLHSNPVALGKKD